MTAYSRIVRLIGVPMDLGASRRGVDMGPSAIRMAGIGTALSALGHTVSDFGNITIPQPETLTVARKSVIERACRALADGSREAVEAGMLPLTLGGDHSVAMGSVAGVSSAASVKGQSLGLLWLDAHADSNTPDTSLTGNWHGMPLAHLMGQGDSELMIGPLVSPSRVALVGARDIDPLESALLHRLGVRVFTMRDIDENGIGKVMKEALSIVSAGATAPYHVSLDLDWVDPTEAPGVGTPVRGGATYREAHLAMELIFDTPGLAGLDVVEVNPLLDQHNVTAMLAVELACSAMGRRIL